MIVATFHPGNDCAYFVVFLFTFVATVLPTYRFGNVFTCGSTRCGKSTAEVIKVVAAAAMMGVATVVLDPHRRSLACNAFQQLIARGMQSRIIYDQIPYLNAAPGYRFLRPSRSKNPLKRDSANLQTAREFIDAFCRRREIKSLATSPQIEEFALDSALLVIHQEKERDASEIQYALEPRHPTFTSLLDGCTNRDIWYKFHDISKGIIKPGYYAAARRFIQTMCREPTFALRAGVSFDLATFLDNEGILLVEGGSEGVSEHVINFILAAIGLQVINYVRRRPRPYPRILLVYDEATNADLIGSTGHEVKAMAELQKGGLDVHVLVQSPNFPSNFVLDGVMTNTARHEWYRNFNDNVARMAAADLGDSEYRSTIHRLATGARYVKDHGYVSREQVTPLDDPWVFRGLGQKKAYIALNEIRKRPEYRSASCLIEQTEITKIGGNGTKRSSTESASIRASRDNSKISSPARRLATGESPSNASEDE